jgi:hypothetical protein
MTKDIDALVAAADALADAIYAARKTDWAASTDAEVEDAFLKAYLALAEYRAAREAVRKGTPPAFATSA